LSGTDSGDRSESSSGYRGRIERKSLNDTGLPDWLLYAGKSNVRYFSSSVSGSDGGLYHEDGGHLGADGIA
jgi:hypothetical protein